MSVRLVSITPRCEDTISYCARVSNPSNQNNFQTAPKLLGYCIKHGHWSPFEMGNMVIEIETSRAIAAQILRHRSFSFQEFSQRYSEVPDNFVRTEARRQDLKNRQNSIDDLSQQDKDWFTVAQDSVWNHSYDLYEEALKRGIAKECARMLLPLSTTTKIYMNGSVRSWMTYFISRLDKSTQIEHRLIAKQAYDIFKKELPNVAKCLEEKYPNIFS